MPTAPYTGRKPAPIWPLVVANVALIFLALLVPLVATAGALQYMNLLGATVLTPAERNAQLACLVVGSVSGFLAVVAGIVAIAGSRTIAPRVLGALAIVSGLIFGSVLAYGTTFGFIVSNEAGDGPGVEVPDCGPASNPTVFGGDSRYTACPDALADGQAFADEVLPALPTEDVTTDAVQRFADELTTTSSAEKYGDTIDASDGTLIAVWVPAPVTCAIFTWDGASWSSEVVGMLADGGRVYFGG